MPPMAAPPATGTVRLDGIRAREWAGVAGVVLFGVGVPLAVAVWTGAFAIPRNDDWAYSRMALHLAATGELDLIGWNVLSLVGHLLWAQPWLVLFGRSLQVLHVSTAVASGLGLVATFLGARRFLPPGGAMLVVVVVAVAPAYAVESTSFMTDPTAFAAQMGCLAAGIAALDRRGRHRAAWLALSMALGLAGFTIREVAAAAPVGVLAGVAAAVGREDRPWGRMAAGRWAGVAGLVAAVAIACAAFYWWRINLPGHQVGIGGITPWRAARQAVRGWCTLALIVSPALLLRRGDAARHGGALLAAALVALAAAAVAVRDAGIDADAVLLSGNALTRRGSMGSIVLLGDKPPILPAGVWTVLVLWACAAGAGLAVRVATSAAITRPVAWLRTAEPPAVALAVFGLLAVGIVPVYSLVGGGLFDRYLWAGAVPVAIGLLRAARPPAADPRRITAWAALSALALLSLAVTVEEYAYAAARWSAGRAAVAAGFDPREVDAGFEWSGYHHRGLVGDPSVTARVAEPRPFYMPLFGGSSNCVTVASSPQTAPALELLGERRYRPFPSADERSLWVYRNAGAC